jgi:glycerol uptake facilitator-like aquaporin
LLRARLMDASLGRRLTAEGVGTAFLLAAVVGSGIMGERLAAGNVAIALLANAVATGAALVALILTFGPISGAHFNPLVTGAELLEGRVSRVESATYVVVQILGAFAGVAAAHIMFGEPLFSLSLKARHGLPQLFSELVATFGLLAVVLGCGRRNPEATPFAVGGYITAAYWFTASTSFANPAVTLARSLSDTFAGIRFADVPGFLVAQILGATTSILFCRWLFAEVKHVLSTQVQRPVPLHGELRAKHHGGGAAESDRGREIPRS